MKLWTWWFTFYGPTGMWQLMDMEKWKLKVDWIDAQRNCESAADRNITDHDTRSQPGVIAAVVSAARHIKAANLLQETNLSSSAVVADPSWAAGCGSWMVGQSAASWRTARLSQCYPCWPTGWRRNFVSILFIPVTIVHEQRLLQHSARFPNVS